MIAIPLKGNKEESSITTVFGKTKYIALVDEISGKTRIESVDFGSGRVLAEWLVNSGVKKVVTKDLGVKPYTILENSGIEVYFCDKKRATTQEILQAVVSGESKRVSSENFEQFFGAKEHTHAKHGAGNHEHNHQNGEKCCGSGRGYGVFVGRVESGGKCCGHNH